MGMLPPGLIVNLLISKFGAPSRLSTSHSISVLTALSAFWGFAVPARFTGMPAGVRRVLLYTRSPDPDAQYPLLRSPA